MFTSSVRGGKAFASEQKIMELKTGLSKLHTQKLKISPFKIIQNTVLNMNLMKSLKYGISPEEIEKQSLAGETYRVVFNMHQSKRTKKLHDRFDRYALKQYSAKRKKLSHKHFIGKKELALAERIKKKLAPGKFYKQSVQNISYFNKERTFIIRKSQPVDGIKHYWL